MLPGTAFAYQPGTLVVPRRRQCACSAPGSACGISPAPARPRHDPRRMAVHGLVRHRSVAVGVDVPLDSRAGSVAERRIPTALRIGRPS